DVATGRFIDRDKLHYIDFSGRWFSVKGPAITPRPPQGRPIVAVLDHGGTAVPYELPARAADIVFVTPHDRDDAARIVERGARRAPRRRAAEDLRRPARVRRPGRGRAQGPARRARRGRARLRRPDLHRDRRRARRPAARL